MENTLAFLSPLTPPLSPIQQSCWVPSSQTTCHPMLLKHLFMAVATLDVEAEADLCFCPVILCSMYIYACTHAHGSWGGVPPGGWAEPRKQVEQPQGIGAFSQPREEYCLELAESDCVLRGGRKVLQLGQSLSQFSLCLRMSCPTALSCSSPGLSFSTSDLCR